MSDDFKKKLHDYTEGKLSREDTAEIEKELDKIETFQAFLEEELGNQRLTNHFESIDDVVLDPKNEARVIKRSKWKARIHNALTALAIVIVGTIICSIITAVFFSTGNPNRITIYRDVVESTIAVTEPNLLVRGGGSGVNAYFTMDFKGNLQKEIGSDIVDAGEIKMSFLFNQVRFPERDMIINPETTWPFCYPKSSTVLNSDWKKLEKLPEGTVAEAYISFDNFYTTDEVLKKFEDKNMQPVWFVVDTGFDDIDSRGSSSFIGFPYRPIWHPDDMTVTGRTYEKKGLFTAIVSESAASPTIEEYGSAKIRNDNFMKTLALIEKYEKMADNISMKGDLRITERLNYLRKNGIKIYGIVVTGPTKEILNLKKEKWITGIHVGEVRLWNWTK